MNPTVVLILLIVPAALYVLWPLFTTGAADESFEPVSEDPTAAFERAKGEAYAAIKEAEFDRRTGKLSDEDYESLVGHLKEQALAAIAAIDEQRQVPPRAGTVTPLHGRGASPEIRFCPQCGTRAVPGGRFCGGCGHSLAVSAA